MTVARGRVPLNALANALNTLLNVLAGFLTLPFLIDRLGSATYGVWVLVVAFMGYFLFFESSFTGAVGRLVAGKRATEGIGAVNSVVSTALVASLPICAAIALVASFVSTPFLWLFAVPAGQMDDVRTALLLVGLATALAIPESIFYAFLWGYERFDLQSLVETPVALIRTILILVLIDPESTLVDLALIIAGTSSVGFIARARLCWMVEPRLSLRLAFWSRRLLSEMFVFGSWFGVLTLSRSRLQDLALFVIGHLLDAVAVTTFTIPRLLTSYCSLFVQSVTQVVAPRAAAFSFGQQHSEQRQLFLIGGRYSHAMGLYFLGGLGLLGLPFLSLWQPGDQREEYNLLMILIAGEILPFSQWVTYSAIVGTGRHRRLAFLSLCEGLCILGLSYWSVGRHGLFGAAVAVAVSGFVFRGLLQWIYGCRLVEVALLDYSRKVFLPITGAAALPIISFSTLRLSYNPSTWLEFCLSGLAYTLIYWLVLLLLLLGWRDALLLARSGSATVHGRTGRSRHGTPTGGSGAALSDDGKRR